MPKTARRNYRGEILDAIRSGVTKSKEIWKTLNMDRRLFWYYKEELIEDESIKEKNGVLRIFIDKEKIARKAHIDRILARATSTNEKIQKLALGDLRYLSAKKIITDKKALKFIIGAIKKKPYRSFKSTLQECLLNILDKIRETGIEKKFYKIIDPKTLKKLAENPKNDPSIRVKAVRRLAERGEFEDLLGMLVKPWKTYKGVAGEMHRVVIEYVGKYQNEAREKLHKLLGQYSRNEEISKRLYELLAETRSALIEEK